MTSITTPGFPTITPILVAGHTAERESHNIVHDSIDPANTNDYVSLAAASRRTGTLTLLFAEQTAAKACLDRHAQRLIFTLHEPGVPIADMQYIVSGRLRIEQSESRTMWIVAIDFREVS
jgi:hypothetical protein